MLSLGQLADLFHLAHQNVQKQEMSSEKIQILCYYAQGYHLAVFKEPLLDAEFVKTPNGLVIQQVQPFHNNIPWQCKFNFVKFIYARFQSFNYSELINMMMNETVWKNAKEHAVISQEAIYNFFTSILTPIEYAILKGDFGKILKVVHDCKIVTELEDIAQIFTKWNAFDGLLAANVTDKWSHQSNSEYVASQIWFPVEITNGYDFTKYVYHMPHVQFKLGQAAKYKNPLALMHLRAMIEAIDYNSNYSEDVITNTRFGCQIIDTWFNNALASNFKPYFQMGELCLQNLEQDAARTYFQQSKKSDARCAIRYAQLERNHANQIALFSEIALSSQYSDAIKAKAKLGLAYCTASHKDKFNLFLDAAKLGNAEGWYRCAIMSEKNMVSYSEYSTIQLYEKAADAGFLACYNMAAEMPNTSKTDKERLFNKEIQNGAPFGHVHLGHMYESLGSMDTAIACFKAAGILGIDDLMRNAAHYQHVLPICTELEKKAQNIVATLRAIVYLSVSFAN